MKRCPECRRDYYDDTLLYCLDDGTLLVQGVADEAATAILPGCLNRFVARIETSTAPEQDKSKSHRQPEYWPCNMGGRNHSENFIYVFL